MAITFPDNPDDFYRSRIACRFGITEALGLGALGLGDALGLGGLFSAGDAAAASATGLATGDIAGLTGASIGEGLAGGGLGFEGTALAGGAGTDLAALTATPGLGTLGTAADFLALPGVTGAGLTGIGADLLGAGAGASGANTAAANAAATGLASGVGGSTPAVMPIEALVGGTQPIATGGTTAVGGSPFSGSATGTPFDTPFSSATGAPAAGNVAPAAPGASATSPPGSVSSISDLASASSAGSPPPAAATAAPSPSIDQLLSKLSPGNLATSAVDAVTKNPLATGLGVAGLGYNIYQGQKNTANIQSLTNTANQAGANGQTLTAQGEALQQYLTNGTLPPQYMQVIDNAVQAAKANAISNAAAQGQSTDPTKNTSLATQLQEIDNQVPTMVTQVGTQLASSGAGLISAGAQEAGLSGQLYQALVQNDTTQAANVGKSIATLAAALNGKTSGNVGGQTITIG